MSSSPITSWQIDGETVIDFIFLGFKITGEGDCSHKIKKMLSPWKKSCDKPGQCIKKQRHYFVDKGLCSKSYGFSSSHVWMWELDHKESWVLKNWCFKLWCWRRLLRVPWDCKEIKPVNPKGNQLWIIIGKTDIEAEAPILWPPDAKSRFIGKDPDTGKDWGQEEKGATEDKMVGCITDSIDMSLSKLIQGDSESQRSLACCNPWGHIELNTT